MKARQTSSQGAFARLFGPINPTRKPPGSPQQDSPASSAPPQSQSGERTRSTESLLWSISTLINLLLVFLLGVVTALELSEPPCVMDSARTLARAGMELHRRVVPIRLEFAAVFIDDRRDGDLQFRRSS